MNILKVSLATYRLTKLAVGDDYITQDIHNKVAQKLDPTSKLSYLVSCPWCISVYAGAAVVVLEKYAPAVNTVLASSAVTGLLYSNLEIE